MSKRNPEYDFAWCPGCGDFGVRRALQVALENYSIVLVSSLVLHLHIIKLMLIHYI